MKRRAGAALAALVLLVGCTSESPPARSSSPGRPLDVVPPNVERPEWGAAFASRGAVGTFVLYATADGSIHHHAIERARERTTPASTFKIYNALVALHSGAVADPDSVFEWDGRERFLSSWNEDQTLREGMERSTVWLFQRIADEVGRNGYVTFLRLNPYGNGRVGTDVRTFWLDGSLRISAFEQVFFLDRLRSGTTGFSPTAEATVRGMMPVLADTLGVRLVGKTGWGLRDGAPDVGWLVGWVERPAGDLVYALRAEPDGPDSPFSFGDRLAIVREILAAEGVLPDDQSR